MKKFLTALLLSLVLIGPAAAKTTTAWKFAAGFYFTGTAADLVSTDRTFNRCSTCYELNPTLPRHPTDARLYGQGAVFATVAYYGLYRVRERYPKTAQVLLWVFGALHFTAAYHNEGVGR